MLLYKPWRRRIDRKRHIRQQAQHLRACEEGGIAMEAQLSSGKEKITVAERNVENTAIVPTDPITPPIDQIQALEPGAPN